MQKLPPAPSPLPPLPPYGESLTGTLLAAREAVMAPLRPLLRERNFTEAQWRVLRVLADGDHVDGRSIARTAMLHPPSVTRIMKELVDRGLVERSVDAVDSRRHKIVLTPAGRALTDSAAQENQRLIARYRDHFGAQRLDAMLGELRAFTRLIAALEPSPEPAPDDGTKTGPEG